MSNENGKTASVSSGGLPEDLHNYKEVGRNPSGSVVVLGQRQGFSISKPKTWFGGGAASTDSVVFMRSKDMESGGPRPKSDDSQSGVSGTRIRHGKIYREDPNVSVEGHKGIEKWHEMRHMDPMVYATWLALALPVVAADWAFVKDSKGEVPPDVVDWMNERFGFAGHTGLMGGGSQKFLWDSMKSVLYGTSPFELVYWLHSDGKFALDMEWRHPRTVHQYNVKDGRLDSLVQRAMDPNRRGSWTYYKTEADRLCVFVHDQEGDNWWGKSLFRPALRAYTMKKDFWLDWAILVERYGSGIPYVEFDGDVFAKLTGSEKENLLNDVDSVLQDLRHGEKAWINPGGPGVEFKLLGGADAVGPDISKGIDRCDFEIQVSGMAQDLGLGRTDKGIRAIGEHFGDIRGNFILSLADDLALRFAGPVSPGMGAATRLLQWEFPGLKAKPRFIAEGIKDRQFRKILKDIPNLVATGALTPDDDMEDALRAAFDFGPMASTLRGEDRRSRSRINGGDGSRNRAPMLALPGSNQPKDKQLEPPGFAPRGAPDEQK